MTKALIAHALEMREALQLEQMNGRFRRSARASCCVRPMTVAAPSQREDLPG